MELLKIYIILIVGTGFLVRGNIAIYDNVSICINGVNSKLQSILISMGIDIVLLPRYSSELNPIELVFNVMTYRFKSRHSESQFNTNEDVLLFT